MSKIQLANITIDTDTITAKEREELRAALAEPVQPKLDIFTEKPKNGETYSYLDHEGDICEDKWSNEDFERLLLI